MTNRLRESLAEIFPFSEITVKEGRETPFACFFAKDLSPEGLSSDVSLLLCSKRIPAIRAEVDFCQYPVCGFAIRLYRDGNGETPALPSVRVVEPVPEAVSGDVYAFADRISQAVEDYYPSHRPLMGGTLPEAKFLVRSLAAYYSPHDIWHVFLAAGLRAVARPHRIELNWCPDRRATIVSVISEVTADA